jgi:hypothetical protein
MTAQGIIKYIANDSEVVLYFNGIEDNFKELVYQLIYHPPIFPFIFLNALYFKEPLNNEELLILTN